MNCETVRMARFRTTGRACKRRGGRTRRGWGERLVLLRWLGKRLIRIVRIERASTRVSGGVEGYQEVRSGRGIAQATYVLDLA